MKEAYLLRENNASVSIKKFFFSFGKDGRSFYNACHVSKRKNFEYHDKLIEELVNSAWPKFKKVYGISAYDLIANKPYSSEELQKKLTRLYYQGENIESYLALSRLKPDGNRIAYSLKYEKFQRKAAGNSFLRNICMHLDVPIKYSDMYADIRGIQDVANIAEKEFELMMRFLLKHDPEMKKADKDFRRIFPSPLTEVRHRSDGGVTLSNSYRKGKSDFRIGSNGKQILVEVKS